MFLLLIKLTISFTIHSGPVVLETNKYESNNITDHHQIMNSQNINFDKCSFYRCSTLGNKFDKEVGGAICSFDCSLNISCCNFSESVAMYASCISCYGGNMTILYSVFANSRSFSDVGAVWSMASSKSLEESALNISYSKFQYNKADRYHGALASNLTNPIIFNCEFDSNNAEKAVGALAIINLKDALIENTTFINNTSGNEFNNMKCPCLFLQSNFEDKDHKINLTKCFFANNKGNDNIKHAIATYGKVNIKINECVCFDGDSNDFSENPDQEILDSSLINYDINAIDLCACMIPLPPTSSNVFSHTSDFTSSNVFSHTSGFTSSNVFSHTSDFTSSNVFSHTSDFTSSNFFSHTSDFTSSNVFSRSDFFSKTSNFDPSPQFTSSFIFSKSNNFESTITYDESSESFNSGGGNENFFFSSSVLNDDESLSSSYFESESQSIIEENSFSSELESKEDESSESLSSQYESSSSESITPESDSESVSESFDEEITSPPEDTDKKNKDKSSPDLSMGLMGGGLGLLLLLIILLIICCCLRKKKKGGCCTKRREKTIIKESMKDPIILTVPRVSEYDDGFINYINPDYNKEMYEKA